jgi:hypothetical protein
MNILDPEIDARLLALEVDYRQAYEASIEARSEFQHLSDHPGADSHLLDLARERLHRIESARERIMVKIERLEDSLLRC